MLNSGLILWELFMSLFSNYPTLNLLLLVPSKILSLFLPFVGSALLKCSQCESIVPVLILQIPKTTEFNKVWTHFLNLIKYGPSSACVWALRILLCAWSQNIGFQISLTEWQSL